MVADPPFSEWFVPVVEGNALAVIVALLGFTDGAAIAGEMPVSSRAPALESAGALVVIAAAGVGGAGGLACAAAAGATGAAAVAA
jgi:hypothetical protein